MAREKSRALHDPWKVLEVARGANKRVIEAAYAALLPQCQPEKHGGSTRLLEELNAAYKLLSDDKKRAQLLHSPKSEGTVIGNYRLLEEIASGGFGTTYRGEHILTERPICLKHCHEVEPIYEETLLEEARAIWDLRHYSLPVMRDFIRLEDDSLALVMSYIPGPTLEQWVTKHRRVKPEAVAWIAERVLNVLRYLHFHGVVHGDIKPQNIILQPETHQLVVVDFGLSMVKPTATSDSKGYTKVFSPPEQLLGAPLVPESDLYSLGMTMLFALSGSAEAAKRLDVPDATPKPLCEFIMRLLPRDVRERPNWQDNARLYEEFQDVREESFGRRSSGLEAIS